MPEGAAVTPLLRSLAVARALYLRVCFLRTRVRQQRSNLLMFITGSPRAPLGGFAALPGNNGDVTRFQLCNAFKDGSFIPSAHTCFNQLSLSTAYGSQAVLRERLLTAIAEGSNQFSMV